jgi:dTDP-4-dehydrorhamnose 3,5-epimerase
MNIIETLFEGVKLIKTTPFIDDRGEFFKIYSDTEFNELLSGKKLCQINRSITKKVGTIRGMHYQCAPASETKFIKCTKGVVFDVVVDLRIKSKTYLRWLAYELSEVNNFGMLIPDGCAHGFQVLEENSELIYLHTAEYSPSLEAGLRYDDPAIGIKWPCSPRNISTRDLSYKSISEQFQGISL